MKKLIVLSGSGISAESGIQTFRGMGGLWEQYDVTELASPQAFVKNPELVLRFYNERRKKVLEAQPNSAHIGLAELQKHFDTQIVTQNVDDLHERAGSKKVCTSTVKFVNREAQKIHRKFLTSKDGN
jgi:NAD-dependent deacetylase